MSQLVPLNGAAGLSYEHSIYRLHWHKCGWFRDSCAALQPRCYLMVISLLKSPLDLSRHLPALFGDRVQSSTQCIITHVRE